MFTPIRASVRSSRLTNHRSRRFAFRHPALPQVRAKRLLVIAVCLAAGVSLLSSFGYVTGTRAANGKTAGTYNAAASSAAAGAAFMENYTDDSDDSTPNVNVTAPGVTQTFTFTGAEQTFVVPADVSEINVVAIGGQGGGGGGLRRARQHGHGDDGGDDALRRGRRQRPVSGHLQPHTRRRRPCLRHPHVLQVQRLLGLRHHVGSSSCGRSGRRRTRRQLHWSWRRRRRGWVHRAAG